MEEHFCPRRNRPGTDSNVSECRRRNSSMHVNDGGYRAKAVESLADRDYPAAGDFYARAAWSILAKPTDGLGPFESDKRGEVGAALEMMFVSGVCYRVAGLDERAQRRGTEGFAVSMDLRRSADAAQSACLTEFAADMRVLGGEEASGVYDDARDAYASAEDVSDPVSVSTTRMFRAASAPVKQMARTTANGEIAIEWDDLHGSDPSDPGRFLGHRVEYKRQRLPSLLEAVVERGSLAAPRGTTEYSTDHHVCPDCGSTDVNWVADSVLCLRCSGRMEST